MSLSCHCCNMLNESSPECKQRFVLVHDIRRDWRNFLAGCTHHPLNYRVDAGLAFPQQADQSCVCLELSLKCKCSEVSYMLCSFKSTTTVVMRVMVDQGRYRQNCVKWVRARKESSRNFSGSSSRLGQLWLRSKSRLSNNQKVACSTPTSSLSLDKTLHLYCLVWMWVDFCSGQSGSWHRLVAMLPSVGSMQSALDGWKVLYNIQSRIISSAWI